MQADARTVHAGFLHKKGARRWFALSADGTLSWSDSPTSKAAKGSLSLTACEFSARDGAIVLAPNAGGDANASPLGRKKKKIKPYVLSSKEPGVTSTWMSHLERVAQALRFVQMGRAASSVFHNDIGPQEYEQQGLATAQSPNIYPATGACPTRHGWLEKAGKRRFFCIQDAVLYWFADEIRTGTDLPAAKPKGSVDLSDCEIRAGPAWQLPKHSTTHNLSFQEKDGEKQKVYVVTASSETSMRDWLAGLTAAQQWAAQQMDTLESMLLDADPSAVKMKGVLTKKGDRRFFELSGGSLAWWDSERAAKGGQAPPNGKLSLRGAAVSLVSGKHHTFAVASPAFRYVLTADRKLQFDQWFRALDRACQAGTIDRACQAGTSTNPRDSAAKASARMTMDFGGVSFDVGEGPGESTLITASGERRGWMMKKGQQRFFVLKNAALIWFASEQESTSAAGAKPKNTLVITGCKVSMAVDRFEITVSSPTGRTYHLTASNKSEAQSWLEELKSAAAAARTSATGTSDVSLQLTGFAEKQGKQRFFVLDAEDGSLSWFESKIASSSSKRAKNLLALAGCSVIPSESFSVFIVQSLGKTYELTFESPRERDLWLTSLQCAVANANTKVDAGFLQCGHLEKKKAQRWFVLTKDGLLLWFDHAQPFRSITKERANGYLQISSSDGELFDTTLKPEGDNPLILDLESKAKGRYQLKVPTADDAAAWRAAFRMVQTPAAVSLLRATCFGAPLERLTISDNGIPVIFVNLMTFIDTHGRNLQGLFRISGSSDLVANFRRMIELDDTSEPWRGRTDDDAVHAAAALLKALLREMPEALFPSGFNHEVLAVDPHDAQMVGECVATALASTLPIYRRTLEYLFKFTSKLCAYAAVTSMDAANLAIVFGPNIIRPSSDEPAYAAMADTPRVLGICRTIIENPVIVWNAQPKFGLPAYNTNANTTVGSGGLPMHNQQLSPSLDSAGTVKTVPLDVSANKERVKAAPGRRPPTRKARAKVDQPTDM